MTKKNKTEKKTVVTTVTTTTTVTSTAAKEVYDVFVLDRSGSMASIWQSTMTGVNEYINMAKRDAVANGVKSYLSLLKFDDQFLTVYDRMPIAEVPTIDANVEGPRGGTALYDAIGKAVNGIKAHLVGREASDDVDVTITIFTDGEENSSKEFKHADITALLKDVQDRFKWTITYVGAGNLDKVRDVSRRLGVMASNIANYSHDAASTLNMFADLSGARSVKSALFTKGVKCNTGYFQPAVETEDPTKKPK